MTNYLIKEITDPKLWHELIKEFEDASIYQLWNFANIIHNEKNVKNVGIFQSDEVIALAQVRFKIIPLLKRGVAYIFNGPVWKKLNRQHEIETLYSIYEVLRIEYSVKKHLLLRINPNKFSDDQFYRSFNPPHYICRNKLKSHRTLYFDLNDDLDALRAKLKRRWRKSLNRAERNNIELIMGSASDLFSMFLSLYTQMINRKKFKEHVDPSKFGIFNEHLEDDLKLQIFIAQKDGIPVSALVGSAIGTTGIALFSATNELGLKYNASNLLHWERIKWFKQMGCSRYDLGGVDAKNNPSVYEFKLGISQNEFTHIGLYESSENIFSTTITYLGEKLRKLFRL